MNIAIRNAASDLQQRPIRTGLVFVSLLGFVVLSAGLVQAQRDPGPRGGALGAGGFYPTLNSDEQRFFTAAQAVFQEIDSVSGSVPGEDGRGLGPTFNGNSCAMCHAEPTVGGSSPGFNSPRHPVPNPQIALATLDGARNTVPSFITSNGPVREARFVRNSSGGADGGVHGLYTIAARVDAPACNEAQPNFAQQVAANNVIFRIPTPTFGLGLVEGTPDSTLIANLAVNATQKAALGIHGVLNTSGNDGSITRFGWKAQNKSLLMFSGEAYNVEQGVTNEIFGNERGDVNGCLLNSTPEDITHATVNGNPLGSVDQLSSDLTNFAAFMRLSAPPTPTSLTNNPSAQEGANSFVNIGCAQCHTTLLVSGASPYTGMSNVSYHPYSDFAVHHMGTTLSDGVTQGAAGPDQFRTAPLWGLGQRLFFLHDGRTNDLMQAILAHSSSGSEANTVINNFRALTATQQQNILNFLRTL